MRLLESEDVYGDSYGENKRGKEEGTEKMRMKVGRRVRESLWWSYDACFLWYPLFFKVCCAWQCSVAWCTHHIGPCIRYTAKTGKRIRSSNADDVIFVHLSELL